MNRVAKGEEEATHFKLGEEGQQGQGVHMNIMDEKRYSKTPMSVKKVGFHVLNINDRCEENQSKFDNVAFDAHATVEKRIKNQTHNLFDRHIQLKSEFGQTHLNTGRTTI